MAVEIAASLISKDHSDGLTLYNPSVIKRLAEDQIPRALVRSWQNAVHMHYETNPFTEGEIEILRSKEGDSAICLIESNPLIVYGATLLVALVTNKYALFMQIGDGDIIVVNSDGFAGKPIPPDERLFANATTSLCSEEAWKDFRQAFMMYGHNPPKMIMISTDGYSNSFESEKGFLKTGTDIAHMLDDGGWNDVKGNIADWIRDASQQGSGDDITLGILAPMEPIENPFTVTNP